MKKWGLSFWIVITSFVWLPNLFAEPILSVQFTAGAPGSTAWVAVNYTTDTNAPSLQFDLIYRTNDLTAGTPVGGNALSDHQVASAEVAPGIRRVLIFSFANTPISNGVLAYVPFAIATNATDHDESILFSNVVVSSASASVVPAGTNDGVLAIAVPPQFSAVFPTNGSIHLQLAGTAGRNYAIQGTTNVAQPVWVPLYTNTAVGGVLAFDDAAGLPQRFYRAVVAP